MQGSAATDSARSRWPRWIGPGSWRLVDAAMAALVAGPIQALMLFLLSPDQPLTLRDFAATLVALSPQILLLFVCLGPFLVWLARLLSVAKTTRRGPSLQHTMRFLAADLVLLSIAVWREAGAASFLFVEPARSALFLAASTIAVAAVGLVILCWLDARGRSHAFVWAVALVVAMSTSLLISAELRRVRVPSIEPESLPGFSATRKALLIDIPGMSYAQLQSFRQGGQFEAIHQIARAGVVARLRPSRLPDPLAAHASMITGTPPPQHGLLGSSRYQPLGDRRSFGILPRGLFLESLVRTPLWSQIAMDYRALRTVGLGEIGQALGQDVALIGDPLSFDDQESSHVTAISSGELGPGSSVGDFHCPDPGDLSDRLFDPPAERLEISSDLRDVLRRTLALDLCALDLARRSWPTRQVVYIRLNGYSEMSRWFAGYGANTPARGVSSDEIDAFGRTLPRYVRLLDEGLAALLAQTSSEDFVTVVSAHSLAPRRDVGRLFGSFASLHQTTAEFDPRGEGFWVFSGRGVRRGQTLDRVLDASSVVPTTLWAMGLPVADDMGGVIHLAYESSFVDEFPLIAVPSFGRAERAAPE